MQAWAGTAGLLQRGFTFPHANEAFLTLKKKLVYSGAWPPVPLLYSVIAAGGGFSRVTEVKFHVT